MTTLTEVSESSCYICGCMTTRIVWREDPYEGRRCGCGLTYTYPTPPPDKVDLTVNLHPDEFYRYAVSLKADWVKRNCPAGKLIEVGCDQGLFLEQARDRGFDIAGIEPDPRRARRAESRLSIPIENCLLEDRSASDDGYDVVYHDDLLAHFRDPEAALRKMSAMLRPGGVLAFEAGILGGVSPLWYRALGRLSLQYHLFLYSRESLRLLLERADLEVLESSVFGLGPAVAIQKVGGIVQRLASGLSPSLGRRVERWRHRLVTFSRYRIGAIAPRIGPLTMLIVARPKTARGAG